MSDSGARGRGFDTYRRRVVSLSKTLYSPKVLVNYPGSGGSVQTWLKNCLLGRKASTQTNKHRRIVLLRLNFLFLLDCYGFNTSENRVALNRSWRSEGCRSCHWICHEQTQSNRVCHLICHEQTQSNRVCHLDRVKRICVFEHSWWQILTAHAQPFRRARDLAFCLKVPLDSLLVWASSGGSGETARMRRLAWTFAARISDKYQIRLTRPI